MSLDRILVLEDDADIRHSLEELFQLSGFEVRAAGSAEEALEILKVEGEDGTFDVVLSDIRLPKMDGLGFVAETRKIRPELPVVLMTAYGDVETAVQGLRLGVFDYLRKPFEPEEALKSVRRALSAVRAVEKPFVPQVGTGIQSVSTAPLEKSLIGSSDKMKEVLNLIRRVSQTSANVLITGESGTGKEVVAKLIHDNGPRKNQPFVAVNCSAIPGELLESELFGHTKGSFTGAFQTRKGLFQEADGGTIFLDEIGDMSLPLQAKLLRVLQERKIKPVGDNIYKSVDIRIMAATHRDLNAAVKNGQFREDLFYRLSVVPIVIPPLRERGEDIMLLATHFLKKYAGVYSSSIKEFTDAAVRKLISYHWPGNVRELENLIERAVIFSQGPEICEKDLEFSSENKGDVFLCESDHDFASLKEIEKRYIAFVLKRVGGKKERAANLLKIDRKTLYRKAIEYGLYAPSPAAAAVTQQS